MRFLPMMNFGLMTILVACSAGNIDLGGTTQSDHTGDTLQDDAGSTVGNPDGGDTETAPTNPTGTLDTTFADSGRFVNVFGQYTHASNVFVSADDHIFVVGNCADTYPVLCTARLTPDGRLDATYGQGGVSTTPLTGSGEITEALLLPDGRIVAGGYTTDTGEGAFAMVAADGKTIHPISIPGSVAVMGMALAPDGSIILVYHDSHSDGSPISYYITKFTNAGEQDTTFGIHGVATVPANFEAPYGGSVVVRPDGKIVVVGCGIMQFDSAGEIDTSFGTDAGYTSTDCTSGSRGAVVLADGRILAAYEDSIIASTADGLRDAFFGMVGKFPVGDGSEFISGILVDPHNQDRFLVTRSASSAGAVLPSTLECISRITTEGKFDNTFGGGGTIRMYASQDFSVAWGSGGVAVQSDGSIVVLSAGRATKDLQVAVVSRLTK